MTDVLFASLAADNAAPYYRALAQYFSHMLGTQCGSWTRRHGTSAKMRYSMGRRSQLR
jgi:hypothetical protein